MIVLSNGAVGVRAMVIAMVLMMVAARSGIWTAFLVSQFSGFSCQGLLCASLDLCQTPSKQCICASTRD